jgi:2-methylcitrate dehydratase PrpD
MAATAQRLADWAAALEPTNADLDLAGRALIDTVAVTVAAREEPIAAVVAGEARVSQWAALAHILDFDDLHMESTTHISAVCVPTVLSVGGDARAYLAGAGVMARIGMLLGWPHYATGWHATTTAGAPAAAAAAAVALGLDVAGIATAIALAVPAAGGVQRSFGTLAKPLQVGFAAEAGARAARLAAQGAVANPAALDQWLELMGVDGADVPLDGPSVPGGLATKLFPCCYAMQRPIAAILDMDLPALAPSDVRSITVRTPQASLHPLVHPAPTTGLESKFSLPYSLAAALLDRAPGFGSFTDEAVRRPEARELMSRVVVETTPGGSGLLDGELEVTVDLDDRPPVVRTVTMPPGSPARPVSAEDLRGKVERCCPDVADDVLGLSWPAAAELLDELVTR